MIRIDRQSFRLFGWFMAKIPVFNGNGVESGRYGREISVLFQDVLPANEKEYVMSFTVFSTGIDGDDLHVNGQYSLFPYGNEYMPCDVVGDGDILCSAGCYPDVR